MEDCQKILILRLGAVGDVVRTLPALKALKESYPFSRITWVVEEPSRGLLEAQPEIDKVVLFPRKRWMDGIKSPRNVWKTIGEMWRFVAGMREQKFQVVLDFHGVLKSGLISILSGSPRRVGFERRSSKEWNFLFSNIRVSVPAGRISRFEKNFVLLRGLGLEANVGNHREKLHIPKADWEYVESFFSRLPTPIRRPLIAIHPGTSHKTSYKRWLPGRYGQLADRLIRHLGASVIFTWGPGEMEWVENIQRNMKEPSVLGPRTESLTQLGEVYGRCDLYIGGDTGPMHIASMMGTPVVVIYGPTDPVVNEPLGRHWKVRKEVSCSPCRKRSCKERTCLKAVAVEDVLKPALEMLAISADSATLNKKEERSNACQS